MSVLVPLLTLGFAAQGAVEALGPQATLRLPSNACPSTMRAGSFSLFAWLYRTEADASRRGILQIPGVASIYVEGDGSLAATLSSSAAGSGLSVGTPDARLGVGQWALLCLSYDHLTGTASLHLRTESQEVVSGSATAPALAGKVLGPPTGDVAFGAHPAGVEGITGLYGLIAVRSHVVDASDVEAVFATRRYLAPFDLDNRQDGGRMNGAAGCDWMTNHSMSTLPLNGGAGGTQAERAVIVDEPVTIRNVLVYQRTFSSDLHLRFRVAVPSVAAFGFVYRSHRDPAWGSFFRIAAPDVGVPAGFVAADAPRARMLVTEPRGVVRVMTSANSRAVKAFDGSGRSPGNYAHGFIETLRSRTLGVLFRPAILTSGGNPWFGLDCKSTPRQSASGTIVSIAGEQGPLGDFSRFFTGSGSLDGRGPGAGLFLKPGAHYSMRCRPEDGSLLVQTAPLVVEAHLLAFPGSSPVIVRPDRGPSQQGAGVQGADRVLPLDTTAYTHVLGPDDAVVNASELHLAGDLRGVLMIGDACFVAAGEGAGGISVISDVQYDGLHTFVMFEHPLGGAPALGSRLHFGPWRFVPHAYEWHALTPDDPMGWRGLWFTPGDGGGGVVLFALSAYRPDVDGYAWGAAGSGGHGYAAQLEESFTAAPAAWMAMSGADVWMQVPAQQNSQPDVMSAYLAHIVAGLPDADVIWAGEMEHPSGSLPHWHAYILGHAGTEGVVGLSVLEEARLGTIFEQYADGWRSDAEHISQRGNRLLAELWLEQLAQAAIDPCPADVNFDGAADILDLLEYLDAFGSQRAWADVNGDEAVDILDLLDYLDGFGEGCP